MCSSASVRRLCLVEDCTFFAAVYLCHGGFFFFFYSWDNPRLTCAQSTLYWREWRTWDKASQANRVQYICSKYHSLSQPWVKCWILTSHKSAVLCELQGSIKEKIHIITTWFVLIQFSRLWVFVFSNKIIITIKIYINKTLCSQIFRFIPSHCSRRQNICPRGFMSTGGTVQHIWSGWPVPRSFKEPGILWCSITLSVPAKKHPVFGINLATPESPGRRIYSWGQVWEVVPRARGGRHCPCYLTVLNVFTFLTVDASINIRWIIPRLALFKILLQQTVLCKKYFFETLPFENWASEMWEADLVAFEVVSADECLMEMCVLTDACV